MTEHDDDARPAEQTGVGDLGTHSGTASGAAVGAGQPGAWGRNLRSNIWVGLAAGALIASIGGVVVSNQSGSSGTADAASSVLYAPPNCDPTTEACQSAKIAALEQWAVAQGGATPTPTPSMSPTTASPSPSASQSPTPTPTTTAPAARWPGDDGRGLLYGAAAGNADPASFEASIGVKLQLNRVYFVGTTPVATVVARARDDIANGRVPWLSFKVPGTWAQFAAGANDAWFTDRVKALAALNGPVWLTLHHEPTGDGTAADWIRMQQHARPIIRANSSNIALVGILNGYPFTVKSAGYDAWRMPVGTGVDIMGFDNYNPWFSGGSKVWRSAAYVLAPGVEIQSWGYPTAVGEYGVRNDPANPGKAAQWMEDAYAFAKLHNFAGMAYFNSALNSPDGSWVLNGERLTAFDGDLTGNQR